MGIGRRNDPIDLFKEWYDEAQRAGLKSPDAMALATVDAMGAPNVRMVLLKEVSAQGFVFFTNMESTKARELERNHRAALCFYWQTLRKQVRIQGFVGRVSEAEADAYFATRDKKSRIGAWASKQSRPLKGRLELERRVARYAAKFAIGGVPRPPFWSGYRLFPDRMEFWLERPFRLHERLVYTRAETVWRSEWLYP